jgi:hypothetical protein
MLRYSGRGRQQLRLEEGGKSSGNEVGKIRIKGGIGDVKGACPHEVALRLDEMGEASEIAIWGSVVVTR